MMANNQSSSMMKHHQAAAGGGGLPIQQHMSYHHHHHGGGGDDHGGGSSSKLSSVVVAQPPPPPPPAAAAAAAASASASASSSAVVCSYNNNNNGKLASGVSGGVLESSYNTSTTSTRFQPNLHGISMDWTPEEQAILDEGLKTYATESTIARYAKIAVLLKNKTVRDVALRYKWMMKRDFSRRRKDDLNLRRSKERKEKVNDPSAISSQAVMQQGFLRYAQGVVTNKNGISYNAIDGVTGKLLRQNARAFEQISANLSTYQVHHNIGLFCQARDNISLILKRINEPPYIMKQMPALPVKVNEELANSILPQSTPSMQ